MLLTETQVHAIKKIIEDHHNALIVNTISPDAVAAEVLEELKTKGLVNPKISGIKDAYLYGQVLAALDNPATAKMSYAEFKQHLAKNPVPLSEMEKQAVKMAQLQAAQYVRGLGNRIDIATGNVLIEADAKLRSKLKAEIRDRTAENIEERETVKQLKSDLGWATGDWARDWDRIAVTEKHNAMQLGLADHLTKRFGPEVLVAKRPMPSACPHCLRLHLGPDGQPRIFRLADLERNGTNVGRKASDWRAVVGAIHPHCFPAGARVTTARGSVPIEQVLPGDVALSHDGSWQRITHTWVSAYHGDMVQVCVGDRIVTATPNHPFLAEGQWLAAESLHEGQNLLSFEAQVSGALSVDLHAVDGPPTSAQHRHLATVLFGFTRGGVPVSAVYLDGELYVREGQVNEAQAEQITGHRLQPHAQKSLVDLAFGFRAQLTSLGLEYFEDHLPRFFLPSDGSVEGGYESTPLLWRHARIPDTLGFPLGAGSYPNSGESSYHGASRYFEELGYRLHRQQIVAVQIGQDGGIQFAAVVPETISHPRQLATLRRIVNVSSLPYEGHVYNLTVAGTNSFVVDGVAVHNCQCQLVRIPAGWGFNKEGDLVPGGKLGIHYEDDGDLALAMLQEHDLCKSMAGGERLEFQGLPILIENTVGSIRTWKDGEGGTGETKMLHAYGYIEGTTSADDDAMDCYVGPDPRAEMAYIIDQQNPRNGIYDEQKVMLGFPNEDDARSAYLAQYTSPDFLVTVSPMAMDAFKRWLSGTRVQKSEPRGPTGPRLVILEKAVTTAEDACQDSRADARAPSYANSGVNYYFNAPKREPPALAQDSGFDPKPKDILTDEEKRNALKRDKRIYEMIEPVHRKVVDVSDIIARASTGTPIGTGDAAVNRHWLDVHGANLSGGQHNDAPVPEKSNPPLVLIKALPGSQATTHKYTERKWMADHWAYKYAAHHGGKIRGHETSLGHVVLKLPVEKLSKLQEFQKLHGISGKIFVTSKYAILPISEAEAHALRAKDTSKKAPAEKPAKTAEKPKAASTLSVSAKDIKPRKALQEVQKVGMLAPPWLPTFVQTGEKALVGGKEVRVVGMTAFGSAIVEPVGTKKRDKVPWEEVQRIGEAPAYKSTYERLGAAARVYKLDSRAQGLLDKALQDEPVPGTTFQGYMAALREHGAETFLVGGFTRDIIAMTAGDGEHGDDAVLKALKDFDVVTTASPSAVHASVAHLTPEGHGIKLKDQKSWGVVRVSCKGYPGLDVAIAVSECGHAKQADARVFDHDLELDTKRRDFTCNSLFYDVDNRVLVDPTGMGVADAQNKVLRLPPMTKAEQYANASLPWRYLKFRARGWVPEEETLKRIKAQFAEQLPGTTPQAIAEEVYRMFTHKGVSLSEAKAHVKAIMENDGMGALFTKHLAGVL